MRADCHVTDGRQTLTAHSMRGVREHKRAPRHGRSRVASGRAEARVASLTDAFKRIPSEPCITHAEQMLGIYDFLKEGESRLTRQLPLCLSSR